MFPDIVNTPGSYQETLPPCLIEVECMLINQGHIRKHYPVSYRSSKHVNTPGSYQETLPRVL